MTARNFRSAALSYRHSRRSFLGAAAGAGIFLPLLRRMEARAIGAPPPPRFLVIQRAVGTVRDQWLPQGTPSQTVIGNLVLNTGTDTRPASAVGGVSSGFEALRTKMTVIDGIDIVTAGGATSDVDGGDKTHEGGMVAVMTGQPTVRRRGQEDHIAGGASIDQIFLANSPLLQGTMFGSLQLGTDARSDRDEVAPRVMSYGAPTPGAAPATADALGPDANPLFPVVEPLAAYQSIFGTLMPGDANANADQLLQLRRERGSLVDYLEGDLARLQALAPMAERPLIDAHLAALQSLDASFNVALDAQEAGGAGSCIPIDVPPQIALPADQSGTNPFHEQIGGLQLAIIRTVFACDFARIATFMWSPGTNLVFFGGLYPGMPLAQHHFTSHAGTLEKEHDLVAIERWYVDRTVEALLQFDSILETDGSTLLDNMVVPFITEVARGQDHDFANAPFAVLGGGNLGLPQERFYRADGTNRPTNDLWLALAPVFQVDLSTLGAQEQYSGALPDFLV